MMIYSAVQLTESIILVTYLAIYSKSNLVNWKYFFQSSIQVLYFNRLPVYLWSTHASFITVVERVWPPHMIKNGLTFAIKKKLSSYQELIGKELTVNHVTVSHIHSCKYFVELFIHFTRI